MYWNEGIGGMGPNQCVGCVQPNPGGDRRVFQSTLLVFLTRSPGGGAGIAKSVVRLFGIYNFGPFVFSHFGPRNNVCLQLQWHFKRAGTQMDAEIDVFAAVTTQIQPPRQGPYERVRPPLTVWVAHWNLDAFAHSTRIASVHHGAASSMKSVLHIWFCMGNHQQHGLHAAHRPPSTLNSLDNTAQAFAPLLTLPCVRMELSVPWSSSALSPQCRVSDGLFRDLSFVPGAGSRLLPKGLQWRGADCTPPQ